MMRTSWREATLLAISLAVLAGCGGGDDKPAATATASDAAAQARAACHAVTTLKPTGSTADQEAKYAKLTAAAFEKAAGLARKAAATDPQWTALADSADKEAKAFATVAAAAEGAASLDAQSVLGAAAQTRAQKPIFTAECQKAEGVTPSPTSTP